MSEDLRLSIAVEKAEEAHIRLVLDRTNWNRRKAAGLLGICYRTMLYRCKQYGLCKAKFIEVTPDQYRSKTSTP